MFNTRLKPSTHIRDMQRKIDAGKLHVIINDKMKVDAFCQYFSKIYNQEGQDSFEELSPTGLREGANESN